MSTAVSSETIPAESFGALFLRFLRFGFLAWGGPVAQIAMIRQELVEEERWVSQERFNHVLAVYQVLPGPEAHELCVYFGMTARGRIGGFLAGLGFMLPGLALMLFFAWVYVRFGIGMPLFAAAFASMQPAVTALIARGAQKIGQHALIDRATWFLAGTAFTLHLLSVPFYLTLSFSGAGYFWWKGRDRWAGVASILCLAAVGGFLATNGLGMGVVDSALAAPSASSPSPWGLFVSGLRAGLLTFGGAYTAIPLLRRDSVTVGQWVTDAQFLDGLGLSGILPAPLIIFGTFLGYLGGGLSGGLMITAGIFLPAFLFTLLGHSFLERLVANSKVRPVLTGITAGVVGLIAASTVQILPSSVRDAWGALILLVSFGVFYSWKSKFAIPVVVLGAAVFGLARGP